MTRRPKINPSTGSALLGSELRRLRGSRTLDEIAALSKAPPLGGNVPPVSASSLSDIETGRQMPKLAMLYSLSMLYRVSMNQLMGYVMEEGLAKAANEGLVSQSEAKAEFERLLALSEWHRALPLALLCEQRATTESDRIGWRGNRATCLARIGLHTEAVTLLTSCAESFDTTPRQRFMVLQMLADIQASAGNIRTATAHAKEALECTPEDASAAEIANLEFIRAELLIEVQRETPTIDERSVREAMRLADRAEKGSDEAPGAAPSIKVLQARFLRARGHALLGNRLVALRDLEEVLSQSVALKYPRLESHSAIELARIRRDTGSVSQALVLLERARAVAEASQQMDVVFEASFQLFTLLRDSKPQVAVTHFRRCRDLVPLLPANSPSVRRFDTVAREFSR